jgi:hypothetical protein
MHAKAAPHILDFSSNLFRALSRQLFDSKLKHSLTPFLERHSQFTSAARYSPITMRTRPPPLFTLQTPPTRDNSQNSVEQPHHARFENRHRAGPLHVPARFRRINSR